MTTELTNAVTALNDVTQKHEQLNEKYQGTHDALSSNSKAMTDWQTQQGTVELTDQHGNKHLTPTLKTLVEQAQSVNPHPHAMTKAQFDALRELRKQQYAGSGFVEWGKHFDSVIKDGVAINEGMWCRDLGDRVASKFIHLGRKQKFSKPCSSRTDDPIAIVDGTAQLLYDGVNVGQGSTSGKDYESIQVPFPPAPDGTKTYDSATGTVTQHTNAEVAFASETATNKVITSRKDLVFLESWHEKIADKDVVYPLGNVQYGASGYEGVTLLNNLVAQGYSAFGEWDENTKGFGAKWSSLTDAQKALFLSEPEHNIYFDPRANAYIQVRYRIRVVEGFGDDWDLAAPAGSPLMMSYDNAYSRIKTRGAFSTCHDYGNGIGDGFIGCKSTDRKIIDSALWDVRGEYSSDRAHENQIRALSIALVQRLNQGAYHPSYNPMGCDRWIKQDVVAGNWYINSEFINSSTRKSFYEAISSGETGRQRSGDIGSGISGRSDQYKFHDAIYAGQVEDLRLNANKLDVNKLREDTMRKAVAGTLRGKQKLMVTKFDSKVYQTGGTSLGYVQIDSNGWARPYSSNEKIKGWNLTKNKPVTISKSTTAQHVFNVQMDDSTVINVDDRIMISYYRTDFNAEYDSLPWVDIIGSPERIAATFPDGVVGQWVPQVPDGASKNYQSNRKFIQEGTRTITDNDGSSWTFFSNWDGQTGGDLITNTLADGPVPAARVVLNFYESLSNFTETSNNAQIVGTPGNVYQGNFHHIDRGNRLNSSVSGVIAKQGSAHKGVGFLNTNGFSYESWSIAPHKLTAAAQPEHQRVDLASGNESGGMKALSTITEKNGLYYLQLHGAELKYTPRTIADMTVINAGSHTGAITKGHVYLFQGFDNSLINRPMIALANNAGTTWNAHSYNSFTLNDMGEIITHTGTKYTLLRAFESRWGDDQTIPIVDGENVKTDLNGNTVKVFCHHTQIPLGIAHND